jgi:hypothetical protein
MATVLIFYNLPQSKRGVYLLALYPALAVTIALLINDAIASDDHVARFVARLTRLAGIIFTFAGAFSGVALIVIHVSPALVREMLRPFGILVPEFADNLRAAAESWWFASLLIPLVTVAVGAYLWRSRPRTETLVAGVFVAMTCVALATNLVVEPAMATTTALKQFASDARKITEDRSVGYFGNLDYDFAFYNGRDLTLTTPLDPSGPALMVSPEDDWKLVPPKLSVNYRVLLRSNPSDLDGSGRMLLLERIGPLLPPAKEPSSTPGTHR